jgi:tetratricopeptide (TPR) repeat protein
MSIRIILALSNFWEGHNPFHESLQWLEKGISLREYLSKNTLAQALSRAVWLAFRQNDPEAGLPYAEECLTLSEELQDQRLLGLALRQMTIMQLLRGDFAEAERYFEKTCHFYQKLGNKNGLASTISDCAVALVYQGNVSRAMELFEGHLDLPVDLDLLTSAWFQFTLAGLKVLQGELEQATALLKNSLHLYCQINHIYFIGNCFIVFAGAANGYKKAIRAAQLFGAREAIHESIGANLDPGFQRIYVSQVAQTRAMLEESAFASAWAEGRAMTLDQAIAYALDES